MIFMCFNIKDREAIAEKIYHHLTGFGMDVWYDRSNIFLGDNRNYENFDRGVKNTKYKYAVVIISPNFSSGTCCNEELDIIYQRYTLGKLTVFPIFYDIDAKDIPPKYSWLTKLLYKELKQVDEKLYVCYHIVAKITHDLVAKCCCSTIESYLRVHDEDSYENQLLNLYIDIGSCNFKAKMTVLYVTYKYLVQIEPVLKHLPYQKCFEKLFSFTKLDIATDKRELQILENTLLLMLQDLRT
jgi:hypothetical protein